ncbi:MAG: DEAD/DEAH box helicase [bacterium]
MTTFKELGLNSEIVNSLDDLGFKEPTAIQEKAIPFILKSKKDLIALAQTGTGKTGAFSLPILNQINLNKKDLQAIILCPTRELCIQIFRDIKTFTKYSKGIEVTAVYGGERMDLQISSLRKGTNIVVGTPGRVHDLIRRKVLKLNSIQWLVLDEADEMLKMGFKDDLDAVLMQTPKARQTFLFSATMSKSVNSIAKQYMTESQEISIGEKNSGADKVSHEYYVVQTTDRFEALKRILDYLPGVYGILFCRTKRETQEISDKLRLARYDAEALHGDITQSTRTKIMDRFKRRQISLLVATDVAARGIDVNDLSHVINYNLPDQNEAYTHRSGRTGRAQKSGISISIISPRETRIIKEIEYIIGKKIERKKVPSGEEICRKQIENFLDEIENVDIKQIGDEQYLKKIAERFEKLDKKDLIKYFIIHKFSPLINACKNAADLNYDDKTFYERRVNVDNASLKINFGKKHGLDIKGLFALFNSNKNLNGIKIGRISLMQEYSLFSVEKKYADEVMRNLSKAHFKGNRIYINMSNERVNYYKERRSAAGRGFARKNREYKERR